MSEQSPNNSAKNTKRDGLPAWLKLTILGLFAGLLLGVVSYFTTMIIQENAARQAQSSRQIVFQEADRFTEIDIEDDAPVLDCYEAIKGEKLLGYVSTIAVQGYVNTIEVMVGMKTDGTVTGISVGGPNFSETKGLGAKVRDTEFTDRFIGLVFPIAIKDDGGQVDAISGATISSRAVTNAVNDAVDYMMLLSR